MRFLVILLVAAPVFGQALPTPPQATVDLTMPTQTGTVRNVAAGSAASLQSAINAATCGDTIVLPANNTYNTSTPITIPSTSCSGWILIESSALASLPASGNRVSTGNSPPTAGTLANMAKIVATAAIEPIVFQAGANHWRLIGIEITAAGSVDGHEVFGLIETDVAGTNQPSFVIVDRCYLHGNSITSSVRRGFSMNGPSMAIVDSDVREIHDLLSGDSQAVGGWDSPGPIVIQNNFLSANSENSLFGGTDPSIVNNVTRDITVQGNYYWKDPAWNGVIGVKNIFELKNAQRVLVDGNRFEHEWTSQQTGTAILFTVVNQGGTCTWCIVADVTFTHNQVLDAPGGLVTANGDNPGVNLTDIRILVQNNQFGTPALPTLVGIQSFSGGPNGQIDSNHTIDHNTIFDSEAIMISGDSGTVNLYKFTNNLGLEGTEAFGGAGCGGFPSLCFSTFFTNLTYGQMLIITTNGLSDGRTYPAGGTSFASTSTAGFTNYAGGNYQLLGSSPFHNAGTDGKDIGVWDWTTLNAAVTAAVNGTFPPSSNVSAGGTSFSGVIFGGGTVVQ